MDSAVILLTLFCYFYYIGDEVVTGLFTQDNISQLTHIVGGICGGVFGKVYLKDRI